jgi:serine/threonine protein kinase
LAEVDLSKV